MTDTCSSCGMPVTPGEYHPYAACLMYLTCRDGNAVRANLDAVIAHNTRAELRAVPQLIIQRSIAPDDLWHWLVRMPGGHIFDVSAKSFESPEACIGDASTNGLATLLKAQRAIAGQ